MVCNDLNNAAKDDDCDPDYDDGNEDDANHADHDDGNDDASCDEGCWAGGEGGRCLFLKGCPAPAHCEERQMKDWIFHFFLFSTLSFQYFSMFQNFQKELGAHTAIEEERKRERSDLDVSISVKHISDFFSISVKHISVFLTFLFHLSETYICLFLRF